MEDWEEKHDIMYNLPRLIRLTNCNVELLARLNRTFSENEATIAISKISPHEKADILYRTAIQKINGYKLNEALIPSVESKFYMPRKILFISHEISREILFSELTNPHVFLFKGVSKFELTKLTGFQPIEKSGNQLDDVSVRFMVLESDEDFEMISRRTIQPVHVILRDEGRYFWIKSSKESDLIRKFIKSERETINEECFANKILSLQPPCALTIADTPGMGKTMLLANLALKIQKWEDKSTHLFIILQEIANQFGEVDSSSSALEKIAAYCAHDDITRQHLLKIMKNAQLPLYLYLDGYDEVLESQLDSVHTFLESMKELRNVKIIMTTRPNDKTRVENILNKFSCEIVPFNLSNQIEFLTTFWANRHGICKCAALEKFGRHCLEALQTSMTDREKVIAGIPLQCRMLAEICAEDAIRACKLQTVPDAERISLFDLYKKVVKSKFIQISDRNCGKMYYNAHVYLALTLLFPDWSNVFKPILEWHDEVDESTLYSIGLLEHGPANSPRFIHRTFAEYLVAEFLIRNLSKDECTDLLFGDILGKRGVRIKRSDRWQSDLITSYDLKHPAIGYFIEMHMKENTRLQSTAELLHSLISRVAFKANVEDICVAIGACCSNDLEHTFDYVREICNTFTIGEELKDRYSKTLPHVVVEHTNNLKLLQKVCEFIQSKFNDDLSFHVTNFRNRYFDISNFTPLHVAVGNGKYEMVRWLVEQYKEMGYRWEKLKYLLHMCVLKSAKDGDLVLKNKLMTIDILGATHRGWFNQEDEWDCSTLFQYDIHSNLILRLLYHGVNIRYSKMCRAAFNVSPDQMDKLNNFIENQCSQLGQKLQVILDEGGMNLSAIRLLWDIISGKMYREFQFTNPFPPGTMEFREMEKSFQRSLLDIVKKVMKLDDNKKQKGQRAFQESVERHVVSVSDAQTHTPNSKIGGFFLTEDTNRKKCLETIRRRRVTREDPFSPLEIVNAMKKNDEEYSVLCKNWETLGMNLKINQTKLVSIKSQLNNHSLTLDECPYELLKFWKAQFGSEATVKKLCDALTFSHQGELAATVKRLGDGSKYRSPHGLPRPIQKADLEKRGMDYLCSNMEDESNESADVSKSIAHQNASDLEKQLSNNLGKNSKQTTHQLYGVFVTLFVLGFMLGFTGMLNTAIFTREELNECRFSFESEKETLKQEIDIWKAQVKELTQMLHEAKSESKFIFDKNRDCEKRTAELIAELNRLLAGKNAKHKDLQEKQRM